ncbi:MAG: acetyl-CoA carboxylase biotin carboxyl carrier protein subunit [candidate division WOR-3 bacterium]
MKITVDNKEYNIVIMESNKRYRASINNESFDIMPEFNNNGELNAIIINDKKYSVKIGKLKNSYQISIFEKPITVLINQDKIENITLKENPKIFTVFSPMSGLVIKLPIKVGDLVSKNSQLLILEAMKMQNEIKSPINGKVLEILTKIGQTVEKNQKLIILQTEE